jgi:hypothetical protein
MKALAAIITAVTAGLLALLAVILVTLGWMIAHHENDHTRVYNPASSACVINCNQKEAIR